MGGDRILLHGLRVRAHHGVHPEERADGQDFVVDVELVVPLAVAAAADDVVATVHYGQLARGVVDAVGRDPVNLIETVADRVARLALEDPRVERVRVTVHKPQAPIGVPFDDVAVVVERLSDAGAVDEPVVIALGANLGEREDTLLGAADVLRRLPGLVVERMSPLVRSTAVGPAGPDPSRPGYVNAVLIGRTTLEPAVLLAALHGIEHVFGRERGERWADRTLDLDLVTQGERRVDGPPVTLPHPRAHLRDFVLAPWLAVDPAATLLGHGAVAGLLGRLPERTLD